MLIKQQLKLILVPALYAVVLLFIHYVLHKLLLLDIIYFLVGASLATLILIADELIVSKYYREDTTDTSLVTRSALFLLAYIPLALFVVTSSGSLIGLGLILALGVSIVIELLSYRNNPAALQQRYLFQVKKEYKPSELLVFIATYVVFVFILHIIVIR